MGSRRPRSAPSSVESSELAELIEQYSINVMSSLSRRGGSLELAASLLTSPHSPLTSLKEKFGPELGELRKAMKHPPVRVDSLGGPVGHNLTVFADSLGLSSAERAVLQLAVAATVSEDLGELLFSSGLTNSDELALLASMATGWSQDELRPALDADGALRLCGVLRLHSVTTPSPIAVERKVQTLVLETKLDADSLFRRFLEGEAPPVLSLDDFAALKAQLEVATKVLTGATATRVKGVNVLFHGATGVGKTEAARVIAKAAGLSLYLAGGNRETGDSPSLRQRLATLSTGNALLRTAKAVLLFDELEDVAGPRSMFVPAEDSVPSKLWMNRLLEKNPVPTIWTANSLAEMDPAFLRRFTLAIEFPPLSVRQRRAAWSRLAGDALTAPELDELSVTHEGTPGTFKTALAAASLAGGGTLDREAFHVALSGSERLARRRRLKLLRAGEAYRLDAVNASMDLVQLTERLSTWRPGMPVSLCLHGKSGTGKSEFVHALSRRLDRPLVVRTASDLRSKFVGDTEKNIAAAFDEAEREGALLLFDEVDTFLADRRLAAHEWERAQANEFLQQLEASGGLVAVTTNLYDGLDPAVLRRFTFKVEFFPLRPEQRRLLWDAHLARFLSEPADVDEALSTMEDLVPGDFGVVARKLAILGRAEADTILDELVAELASRRHVSSRPIGFRDHVPSASSRRLVALAQRTVNQ